MTKTYYNIETRVVSVSDLTNVKGKPGKRVYNLENGVTYSWDSVNFSWIPEAPAGYNYYVCQLFQNGSTGTPYDNVLGGHTLSDYITWERLDVGLYRGTLEGAFPAYKTDFVFSGLVLNPGTIAASPAIETTLRFVGVERVDDDTILVTVTDNVLTPADGLEAFHLEIRVYEANALRD